MSDTDPRHRILHEALKLFAHQGYGSTSVREVVERAGVTKPTLYYHFDSKEGLFREVIQSLLDGLTTLVAHTVDSEDPVEERLRGFLNVYMLGAMDNPDAMRLMMTCSLPDTTGQPDVDVLKRHIRAVEALSEVVVQGQAAGELRAGVDPRFAITALLGAAHLHLSAAMAGADLDAHTIDAILDTWMHGVAP